MEVFAPLKELSKFFIIMAMAAIGLHTNIIKLVKTGGKPILMGMACWIGNHPGKPWHAACAEYMVGLC